jgi:hypothetical protein
VGKPEEKTESKMGGWDQIGLREIGWGVWSGFTWLSIGIVGGLL